MTVIGVTDVVSLNRREQKTNVFKLRRLKNIPISETVGNGLCAVPENVAKITCVGKRNHPPICHSDRSASGVEESTQVAVITYAR